MSGSTIYVETSVWSYAFAEDAPESRDATLAFFEQARAGRFEVFVSEVVLAEIGRAPRPRRSRLRDLIEQIDPLNLRLSREADRLARRFVELNAVPSSKIEDAQHVAIAVVNELDVLVSWNYRHLVNVRRREAFRHVSAMSGYYKPLLLAAPPEVIHED